MSEIGSNAHQHLTVEALTQYIKRKFDVDPYLQRVSVVGEVSNFRLRPNNHQYFSLKDDQAVISAVMFRNQFAKVPFQLEEGMKVLATGKVTVYQRTGRYQITIDTIEPDGIGALYQALEQLKKKLHAQGMFDGPKKIIPRYPKKIAVITSPTGSVIRDILTTIQRRYPIVGVTVFPTKVQGSEAVGEIVSAFGKVSQLSDQFDTVILARGGGSIEDLWCFNDEAVAHAIADCPLPVISSIGHETDTTIADLVADMRAPTPTAAAELSVPVLLEVQQKIVELRERLITTMNQQLLVMKKHLEQSSQSYVMQQPERLYQPYIQQVDMAKERLFHYQSRYLEQLKYQLQVVAQRLQSVHPQQKLDKLNQEVLHLDQDLKQRIQLMIQRKENQFIHLSSLLDAHSPLKNLQRGYVIVEESDQIIKKGMELKEKDIINVEFYDAKVKAEVKSINPIDRQNEGNEN